MRGWLVEECSDRLNSWGKLLSLEVIHQLDFPSLPSRIPSEIPCRIPDIRLMYPIGNFKECLIDYHLEYPVVEYLTEDRLCNNCSFWVWDPHEESQEPRRIA